MQALIKYISQFLLIPLIKELFSYIVKKVQDHLETKRLEKENRKKVEEYEQSTNDSDARDTFGKLP